MNTLTAQTKIRKATISAKVIRADGRVEDLGVVWSNKSYIKNLINRIKKWLQF